MSALCCHCKQPQSYLSHDNNSYDGEQSMRKQWRVSEREERGKRESREVESDSTAQQGEEKMDGKYDERMREKGDVDR